MALMDDNEYLLSNNTVSEIQRLIIACVNGEIDRKTLKNCIHSITMCCYPYVSYEVRKLMDRLNKELDGEG